MLGLDNVGNHTLITLTCDAYDLAPLDHNEEVSNRIVAMKQMERLKH